MPTLNNLTLKQFKTYRLSDMRGLLHALAEEMHEKEWLGFLKAYEKKLATPSALKIPLPGGYDD